MDAAPRGFHRSLKLVGALLLTLSAITPAASVAVIIPGIILQAGTGALASLGFGALVALAIAYVYAELGSAHPIAGGDYALIGKTLGPFAGFTYLGVRAVSVAFAPGVLCLGAAGYLKVIWPAAPAVPVAIGIIWFATGLGVLNIRRAPTPSSPALSWQWSWPSWSCWPRWAFPRPAGASPTSSCTR